MKSIYKILSIVFLLSIPSHIYSQIKVEFRIDVYEDTAQGVSINIISDDGKVNKNLRLSSSGKVSTNLSFNNLYTVKISKKAFVTKIVEFNTDVSQSIIDNGEKLPTKEVNLTLYPEKEGVDISIFSRAVKRFAYDRNTEDYSNDLAFEKALAPEISAVEKQLITANKEIAQKLDVPIAKEEKKKEEKLKEVKAIEKKEEPVKEVEKTIVQSKVETKQEEKLKDVKAIEKKEEPVKEVEKTIVQSNIETKQEEKLKEVKAIEKKEEPVKEVEKTIVQSKVETKQEEKLKEVKAIEKKEEPVKEVEKTIVQSKEIIPKEKPRTIVQAKSVVTDIPSVSTVSVNYSDLPYIERVADLGEILKKSIEKEFNKYIEQARNAYSQKHYLLSKYYYSKAAYLIRLTDDDKEKYISVESKMEEMLLESIESRYNSLITKAETYYAKGSLVYSQYFYNLAKQIKPDVKEVEARLTEIEKALNK